MSDIADRLAEVGKNSPEWVDPLTLDERTTVDEAVEALREMEAAIESLSPGCRNQLMEIVAWNREVGGTDEP